MEVPNLILKVFILCFLRLASSFPLAWHITCFKERDSPYVHQVIRRDVSTAVPTITSILVNSTINTRFVSTTITKEIVNSDSVSQDVTFRFQLPADAFISDFVMIIDGVRYQAEVKPKEEAQKAFDEAKDKGQNAGQVKQSGSVDTSTDEFEININVSPDTISVFHLQFQQLLHRNKGVLQHKIHLSPGEVVDNVEANIYIKEPQGFSSVEATWEQDGQRLVKQLEKVTPSDEVVYVHFSPSTTEQRAASDHGLNGHFNVVYDVIHDEGPGDIQIHNGYFVHHISPEGIPITRKDVIFVIDVSGSMSGGKLSQTKSALSTIIDDVRDFDLFSIITFSNRINTWKRSLVSATREHKNEALEYVQGLDAKGGTNLYGGLVEAVDMFETFDLESPEAFPMIIMLTDGVPTSGETNRDLIVSDITERIQNRIGLFCLGFGSDVDNLLLERLAVNNQGVYKQISVEGNPSDQLTGFYDEVASPLLFNIDIHYTQEAVDQATLTQSTFISYFQGQELVVAGKLNPSFTGNELVATVMANSLDERVNWELLKEVEDDTTVDEASPYVVADFAERLWAYLTIKELLLQSRVTMSESRREEFRSKALNMSLHYRFVTPLTSLLIIQPEKDYVYPLPLSVDVEPQGEEDQPDRILYNTFSGGNEKDNVYPIPLAVDVEPQGEEDQPDRILYKNAFGGNGGNAADSVKSSDLIVCLCLTITWVVLLNFETQRLA